MQVKYISDLHLYDSYSLDWRSDFRTLDEIANHIVESWNAFTAPDDIVIVVGDIGFCCPKTIDVLNKLNGRKILVKGNHDVDWGEKLYTCGVFSGVHDYIDNNGIYVQHIPDENTIARQYFVHGHHHRYDMPGMQRKLEQYARDTYRLNCAADLLDFHPQTITELILTKEVLLEDMRLCGLL